MQRRQFMRAGAAVSMASALSLGAGCAAPGGKASGKVVVVGGGYAGATAAKYIRKWSDGQIAVTLVEPEAAFVSCPISNLVLSGVRQMDDITTSYDNLSSRHGIELVRDRVSAVDLDQRQLRLAGGSTLTYDRLVLAPGVDFMWDQLPGMDNADAQEQVLHAWQAGPQTAALRRQLEAMPDGGVYALTIPLAPYRCPPGPYERACQIAHYFKQAKPRAKVLVLDANEDVTSKGALFKKAWADRYAGILEYRPEHKLVDVDVASRTLKFEFADDITADVLNVVPPMHAGSVVRDAGLATANKRWAEVDWLTMESVVAPNVHVLGDSIQTAPLMPKSGHMANQHGKTAAAAIVALLSGQEPNPLPIYTNTCYSFVSDSEVIHVASVHRYDSDEQTMLTVPDSGGLSSAASELEGRFAMAWARNIWADTLA